MTKVPDWGIPFAFAVLMLGGGWLIRDHLGVGGPYQAVDLDAPPDGRDIRPG